MKSINKKRQFFIIFITFLVFSVHLSKAASEEGYIYSRPSNITADFDNNKLIVTAKPEIWNPMPNMIKFGDEYLLNFGLAFKLSVLNNTNLISYTEKFTTTLVGHTSIPSGLSQQNLVTAVYNFSHNFSNKFQEGELFKAIIYINTVVPTIIDQHSGINGTKVIIENNNLTIVTVNPSSWGEIKSTANVLLIESVIFVSIALGYLRVKSKSTRK
jgi:hypothetical protein